MSNIAYASLNFNLLTPLPPKIIGKPWCYSSEKRNEALKKVDLFYANGIRQPKYLNNYAFAQSAKIWRAQRHNWFNAPAQDKQSYDPKSDERMTERGLLICADLLQKNAANNDPLNIFWNDPSFFLEKVIPVAFEKSSWYRKRKANDCRGAGHLRKSPRFYDMTIRKIKSDRNISEEEKESKLKNAKRQKTSRKTHNETFCRVNDFLNAFIENNKRLPGRNELVKKARCSNKTADYVLKQHQEFLIQRNKQESAKANRHKDFQTQCLELFIDIRTKYIGSKTIDLSSDQKLRSVLEVYATQNKLILKPSSIKHLSELAQLKASNNTTIITPCTCVCNTRTCMCCCKCHKHAYLFSVPTTIATGVFVTC